MQAHAQKPSWVVGRTFTGEVAVKGGHDMSTLTDDVDDVHRHAAGKADGKQLHRRRSEGTVSIDDELDPRARRGEDELLGPDQIRGERWPGFGHRRGDFTWSPQHRGSG